MPNRILRDWTDSETLENISPEGERLFTRLIMKADDFGRYHADPRLVRAGCFPLLTNLRDTDISRWIAECEKAGLIAVYQVGSRSYLAIVNFGQRLYATSRPKYPCPLGEKEAWVPPPPGFAGTSRNPPEVPARATNTNKTITPHPPVRLHGIPANADEVVDYGRTCMPKPVPEDVCRAFFAHYEGQARTNPNGDVFWITSGEVVITNWKVRLPQFGLNHPAQTPANNKRPYSPNI